MIEKLFSPKSQVTLQQISAIALSLIVRLGFSVAYCKSSLPHTPVEKHKMKPSKCKCETNCELAAGKMKVKACRVGS